MDIAIGFWINNFRYRTICFNRKLGFPYNGHIMLLVSWWYIRVRKGKWKHTKYCEVFKCHYSLFLWKSCRDQPRFFLLCFVTLGYSTIILKSCMIFALNLILIWIPQFAFKRKLYWCICDERNLLLTIWLVSKIN